MHCDMANYENYTIIEIINDFCEIVPSFFFSYDHLYLLFTHRYKECDKLMVRLRTDLMSYPPAPVQAKLARIIHMYFINLPWLH